MPTITGGGAILEGFDGACFHDRISFVDEAKAGNNLLSIHFNYHFTFAIATRTVKLS